MTDPTPRHTCPSAFVLDQLYTGEISGPCAASLLRDLEGCHLCQAYLASRRTAHLRLRSEPLFLHLLDAAPTSSITLTAARPSQTPPSNLGFHPWKRWWTSASWRLTATTALAAFILLLLPSSPDLPFHPPWKTAPTSPPSPPQPRTPASETPLPPTSPPSPPQPRTPASETPLPPASPPSPHPRPLASEESLPPTSPLLPQPRTPASETSLPPTSPLLPQPRTPASETSLPPASPSQTHLPPDRRLPSERETWIAKSGRPVFRLLYLQEGGKESQFATQGQALAPGDLIQIAYHLPHAAHLLIVSLNDQGDISVIFPYPGKDSQRLPQGEGRLPEGSSLELDDTLGHELYLFLSSPKPFTLAAIEPALKRAFRTAQKRLLHLDLSALPFSIQRFWLQKRPRLGRSP